MLGVKPLMGVDEATTADVGGGTDVGAVEVAGELGVGAVAEAGLGGMLLFTTLLLLRALVVLAVAAADVGVDVVDGVDFEVVVDVVCCSEAAEDALLLEAD